MYSALVAALATPVAATIALAAAALALAAAALAAASRKSACAATAVASAAVAATDGLRDNRRCSLQGTCLDRYLSRDASFARRVRGFRHDAPIV